ncbi:anti-sigma factor domain-containing protein [Oceanobacillus halotolerans]|uniref:anti-sigma factor domain-containing protein n=1 Tax=Oceanobacillus halotolerans TaxID=2663380 RepID=UPI0013D97FE3|nr:anti-sigma factor [Oceanobacillus halotolerans]
MTFGQHIEEQQVIDYVLGNLSEQQEINITEHTEQCSKCQAMLADWSQVLQPESEIDVKPSPSLKEKIWEEKERKQIPKQKIKRHPRLLWVMGSVAVLLFLLVELLPKTTVPNYTANSSFEVMHNGEISDDSIQTNPQTKQLEIESIADFDDVSGDIWVNDRYEELLVEVEGLLNRQDKDYQLWLIYPNNTMKGELLSIENGSSRVLIKGKDVSEFELIKASLEPVGGSKKPSGPDSFIVELGD